MGYKDWLLKSGLTEAQIEEKLAELDEVEVIEVDCWEELNGKVINGFRFGFIKQLMSVSRIEKGVERNHAVFNVELNPTFAIESWLIARGLNVMVIGERIGSEEEC